MPSSTSPARSRQAGRGPVAAFESWRGGFPAVVFDDLHILDGRSGEPMLGRLGDDLPPSIAVLAATRRSPTFDPVVQAGMNSRKILLDWLQFS